MSSAVFSDVFLSSSLNSSVRAAFKKSILKTIEKKNKVMLVTFLLVPCNWNAKKTLDFGQQGNSLASTPDPVMLYVQNTKPTWLCY